MNIEGIKNSDSGDQVILQTDIDSSIDKNQEIPKNPIIQGSGSNNLKQVALPNTDNESLENQLISDSKQDANLAQDSS